MNVPFVMVIVCPAVFFAVPLNVPEIVLVVVLCVVTVKIILTPVVVLSARYVSAVQ